MALSPPPVPLPQASFPLREGNEVQPWIDGIPFYSRLHDAFCEAQHSIWFVVSFIQRDFCFPQGPSFWSVLTDAHHRGIDVKVLFWHNPQFFQTGHLFLGDAKDRERLNVERAMWQARWCTSGQATAHCHHHKFWLVDVGQPTEIGFVGGMTWGKSTLATPAHTHAHTKHDISTELRGPCVRDVADIFCAHWNHALPAQQPGTPLPWPEHSQDEGKLKPPGRRTAPLPNGIPAQITRSIRPGDVGPDQGEDSIAQQYLAAFQSAKRSIYIENQHPGQEQLLQALEAALQRGVEVVMIVPGVPMKAIYDERKASQRYQQQRTPDKTEPRYYKTFTSLARLQQYQHFTMMALANQQNTANAAYKEIYVHAKICIVDAEWVTCGSANFVDLSLDKDHTECNVSWWSRQHATEMLSALIAEHTGNEQTSIESDERTILRTLVQQARNNTTRRNQRQDMIGHAYTIDAARYPSTSDLPILP